VNAPYGPMHKMVRHELPCSPCRDKNCKERTCLTSITPQEVFEEVKEMWNAIKTGSRGGYPLAGVPGPRETEAVKVTGQTLKGEMA
jgi:hypothetical protein